MEMTASKSSPGLVKAFITNGGGHTPETMAEMTMHQLVHPHSNPSKSAAIRQELVQTHAAVQRLARLLFEIMGGTDEDRRMACEILMRDFGTSLSIERQQQLAK